MKQTQEGEKVMHRYRVRLLITNCAVPDVVIAAPTENAAWEAAKKVDGERLDWSVGDWGTMNDFEADCIEEVEDQGEFAQYRVREDGELEEWDEEEEGIE
jgi:hypothetical protein